MKKAGITLVVALLLLAAMLQWGVDRTPAGSAGGGGDGFPSAAGVLDSLGGIRQYVAYVFYIKTDKLHHTYYGSIKGEDELIPYFVLITLLDSHYTDAYYVGAGLMQGQGRNDEAIEFTLRGIEANPDSADLYSSLADLYLPEKRYEEARDAFANAFQREPDTVSRLMIMRGLVASYRAMGEGEKARRALMDLGIYYEMLKYGKYLSQEDAGKIVAVINQSYNEAANAGAAE